MTAHRRSGFIAGLLTLLAVVPLGGTEARQGGSARGYYQDGAIVTAYSRHNNGSISAPIRKARFGWEVQLPRGSWIGCRRSCEETLRVETIDIFDNDGRLVGYGTLQSQCGVFGCLELHLPY
jgi:hypothetical protein